MYAGDGVGTDARGNVRLEVSRVHPPQVQARKDGFHSSYARPQVSPDDEVVEVKLALKRIQAKDRVIAGRVTDAQGRPIAGATVEWKDGADTRFGPGEEYGQFRAVTQRDGSYRLEYQDDFDRCHLGVAAKGWAPIVSRDVKPGTPAKPAEVNFTLEPGHWLKGRVLDEASRPMARVQVLVMPTLDLLSQSVAYPAVQRETETDGDGRFQLEDLPGPKAAIWLDARDAWLIHEEEIAVDRELELVFLGYGDIRGRLTDAETGEPVPAFTVKLVDGKGIWTGRMNPGESFTSSEGRFVLKRLHQRASYAILIEAEGYVPEEFRDLEARPEGQGEEVEVALSRGRPLEGVLVDAVSGVPLPGVEVFSTTFEGAVDLFALEWDNYTNVMKLQVRITGQDGAFRFREGKPVTLMIRAKGRRRRFIPPEERAAFRVPGGRLRIPLERGARLSGVFFLDGKPAPGIEVRLERAPSTESSPTKPEPEGHGPAKTDGDGKFSWDDLAPGSYFVEVTRKLNERPPDKAVPEDQLLLRLTHRREFEVKVRRAVEVPPGEETRVELGRELGTHTLRGRITGMEGRTSVSASLTLKPMAEGSGEELLVRTYRHWDWRFACPFLRPGKYEAVVRFYVKGGTRSVSLPPLEVMGNEERDLEVPAEKE